MTRSEEQLLVRTERKVIEKIVLRKRIKTEFVTQTIPVRKEYLQIERVPVGDDDNGVADMDNLNFDDHLAELAEGIILSEERVVVSKEIVPIERIKIIKKQEQYNALIEDTIRKEVIHFDQTPNLPAPAIQGEVVQDNININNAQKPGYVDAKTSSNWNSSYDFYSKDRVDHSNTAETRKEFSY